MTIKLTGANMIDAEGRPYAEVIREAEGFMRESGEAVIVRTVDAVNTSALLPHTLGKDPAYNTRWIGPGDGIKGVEHGLVFVPAGGIRR